jgi:ankyrin repeat protein
MSLREYWIRDESYPLYSYSAKNWGYHARHAYAEVKELVHAFLENGFALRNSLQALREDRFLPIFRQTILTDVSMMHSAAWFGLDECIARLLGEGYSVDSADDDGQTPLHWAIRNQQVSTVKLLLEQNACVNLVDKEGKSALHYAINQSETDLLQVLGTRNANLELADVKGRTPLLTAVEASSIVGTKYLLDMGANPTAMNFKQQNVLHLAALAETDEALKLTKLLLPHCVHLSASDLNNMTPLHYSVAKGNKELSKFLLQNGVDINTGIQRVCKDHPTVQRSIPDMVPRDYQRSSSAYEIHGLTPLHFAALAAHPSMIDFLLSEGANVNARCWNGDSPLHLTLRKSLLDVDRIFSSNSSNLPFGYIPMNDAWSDNTWQIESLLEIEDDDGSEYAEKSYGTIFYTRMKCVDILIAHPDIDVGLKNALGETPMHVIPFGQENSMAIFSKIANKSQDMFATDNKGQTPLHIACLKSDRDVANYLLDVDPLSVFKFDLQKLNPLHYAIRSWDVTLVTMLLNRVAEQDGACAGNHERGRPLLHVYLEEPFCRPEMVRALLAYGENVNLISYGNSPLSIYLRSPHFENKAEICQLLIEEGANPLWTNSQGENLAHVYMHTTVQDCQVLQVLRDSGLDIFGIDNNKKSILHHAAIHGTVSRELVGTFSSCSIHSLCEPDCENLTPLMYAERNARQDDHGAETLDGERWQITLDLLQMMENDAGEQET